MGETLHVLTCKRTLTRGDERETLRLILTPEGLLDEVLTSLGQGFTVTLEPDDDPCSLEGERQGA